MCGWSYNDVTCDVMESNHELDQGGDEDQDGTYRSMQEGGGGGGNGMEHVEGGTECLAGILTRLNKLALLERPVNNHAAVVQSIKKQLQKFKLT